MEGLMREFVKKQNDHNHENAASSIPSASATALRFFNVYGPRQDPKNPYSGVLSLFLDAAVNGKDITILGDGLMTRDFVYVKDVARAIVMALLQEKEAEDASFSVYNVCTGKSITINTLAEQVKHSTESSSNITHLDPRDGDIRESSCNPNGAKNGMGFIAAMSQEGGLKKTTDWFRSERELRLRR
jgi:UDP-glucose 4-epimerase